MSSRLSPLKLPTTGIREYGLTGESFTVTEVNEPPWNHQKKFDSGPPRYQKMSSSESPSKLPTTGRNEPLIETLAWLKLPFADHQIKSWPVPARCQTMSSSASPS